ncbi:hypothetical protein ACHAXT_003725 [Thalassiosira profunda]
MGVRGESMSEAAPILPIPDVTLKPDVKFSDGTPVTAEHVADCLNELNEKNDSAQSSLGKLTATPLGELDGAAVVGLDANSSDDTKKALTVRIESERPTHVMDAVLAEWVFVVYLAKGDGNFVFTGPYEIESFGEDKIELVPNPHYDERALERPRITIEKFADGNELAEGLEDGGIDIGFHLPIDTLPDLRKADGVRVKSFEVGYHYMAFHNLDTLPDVRVRKAIDLAIDRTALSQALAGGNPTRSLFPDYSPYYSDESDSHGDPDAAAALLDEAGWGLNAETGLREKDGQVLTLRAVAYPHRPGLVIMLPVIEESLEDLGIDVATMVTGDDWDETQSIIDGRTFDILLWAQHTLPAGDPLWFLSAFFRSDGGNNHANLRSDGVDALIDAIILTTSSSGVGALCLAVAAIIGALLTDMLRHNRSLAGLVRRYPGACLSDPGEESLRSPIFVCGSSMAAAATDWRDANATRHLRPQAFVPSVHRIQHL